MDGHVVLTGMVLTAMPVGDYDKRITILTTERGKITAFARGARRPNSQLLASSNPFCFGEFELIEGRSAYTVVKTSIKNYFRELTADPMAAYTGFYFLEFASYICQENNDEKEMLKLLYQSLRALQSPNFKNELVRGIFEYKALTFNGEGLQLSVCTCCGKKENPGKKKIIRLTGKVQSERKEENSTRTLEKTLQTGTPPLAAARTGTAPNGTPQPAAARTGTAPNETPQPAAARTGTAPNGITQPAAARTGTAPNGTSQPAAARTGTAPNASQPAVPRTGTAPNGTSQPAAARTEKAPNGMSQTGMPLNYLSLGRGGILCDDCSTKFPGFPVSQTVLYTMRYISSARIEKLYSFALSDDVLNEFLLITRQYVQMYVRHTFHSLEILEGLSWN